MATLGDSVERINPAYFQSKEKYLLYLRHVFAYEHVTNQLPADAHVLEIGSGEGYGANLLAAHVGRVEAVDVDPASIEHAKQQYAAPDCHFRLYEGERLPYDDESFDHVVSMQVIEHIEDDVGFVREAHRVLKDGGSCWITTPNRTHRVPPGEEVWNPFHVREYYPDEFAQVLQCVFDDVSILGISSRPEILEVEHARVERSFSLRKLIPEPIKALLDGDVKEQYSTKDFHIVEGEAVNESLDLLGVCQK